MIAPTPFAQRAPVMADSSYRPLGEKAPIGTAITERGAKRVYWGWEVANFREGQRWYPKTMEQDAKGAWRLGAAVKR